jgi:MarC family integral membrane protein
VIFENPAVGVLHELQTTPYVRFSLLAVSSIFFLVDPFAAIPSFLAITESCDAERRRGTARKGALTCFIVLTTFALAGRVIFRMFGITLPAFEIAGGLILLLIGLDMLEAKRSPTQETSGDTEEAAAKECADCAAGDSDAGRAGGDFFGDGAGGPGDFGVADGGDCGLHRVYRAGELLCAGWGEPGAWVSG